MQAMILSHEGCASRCSYTELHEDLVIVADFKYSQFVTMETIIHVNECRDTN